MSAYTLPARSPARGLWGLTLFVLTEATLFGCLIGTWFYLRAKSPGAWPPAGVAKPDVAWTLALTGALVLTSVPVQLAWRAGRAGRARAAQGYLLAAAAVQVAYLVIQLVRYADDVRAHPPELGSYTSILHVLAGADHAHVFVGVLFSLFLVAKLLDGRVTRYRRVGLQSAAWYWHTVNAVTLAVALVELSTWI
jgi:cytochrome c oxidase subunit III